MESLLSMCHDLLILCDAICRYASNVCGFTMTHEGIKRNLFEHYEFPVFLLEAHNKQAQSLVDRFKRAISICEATSGWDPLGAKEIDPGTGDSGD
ncbi:hypothetical protein HYALB_00002738 [Hymenoscyphus albidus]|uniref:Uncharacterized protein n=1 Tax=Hymenoscyphus albidus TaxID=595503 RepID=A0A9N9LXV5_9HELO|nr:hypothetical protein HYALB_00002738 [Hymenoscyphus albidus]